MTFFSALFAASRARHQPRRHPRAAIKTPHTTSSTLHVAMDAEPSDAQARELQTFMETENQKAIIQQAISKLTETCFDKCVTKPGNKLDSSEANCIANCAGRYLDSSVFIVNRMMAKRQQQ